MRRVATVLELTYCPGCGAPAEVLDDYEADSTNGPVRHVVTMCVMRHRYVSAEP